MDISILNEKPKYRKEIITLIKPESKLNEIIPLIEKQIKLNYQVFWVCPLIEQSKKLNFSSAKRNLTIYLNYFQIMLALYMEILVLKIEIKS